MKSKIVVRSSFIGLHRYKDAPEPVKFLRDLHRHTFNVEIQISVTDNDRELEFIMVKDRLSIIMSNLQIFNEAVAVGCMSCEQMAEYIIGQLQVHYGENRFYQCSVFEDGENGAIVCTE